MKKTYVGVVRDHSGSMRNFRNAALEDYNLLLEGLCNQDNADNYVYASVAECGTGVRPPYWRVLSNVNTWVKQLRPLTSYVTDGGCTPLFDTVAGLVREMRSHTSQTDANSPDVAFLVMVITDGYENASRETNAAALKSLIHLLQMTDKWTFVFRVPKGNANALVQLGIPRDNILEWELTTESLQQSTVATSAAMTTYFNTRAAGGTSTKSFYANVDTAAVSKAIANRELKDISSVRRARVPYDGYVIKPFCELMFSMTYTSGYAYYELTKPETLQEGKNFIVGDRTNGRYYSGACARQLLGLPQYGSIKLRPGYNGQYDIFVQSKSVNRKLVGGTQVLYYEGI